MIGTGFGSLVHVPALQQIEGCTVLGIASAHPERVHAAALKHKIPAFDSVTDLLASPDITVVSVAVPPKASSDIIRSALKAGKHVFVEKPVCSSVKEVQEVLAVAKSKNLHSAVNFEFRELPVMIELKRRLQAQECGQLRSIDIAWVSGGWADPNRPFAWQSDAAACGGVMTALGVHVFDYVEWLFGPIARLTARTGIAIPKRPGSDGKPKAVTAPDHAQILLELATGTGVTINLSNVAPHGTGHWIHTHGSSHSYSVGSPILNNFGAGYAFAVGACGSTVMTPISVPDCIRDGEDGRIPLTNRLASRFIDSIRHSKSFSPSLQEGLRTRVLLEAVEHSAKERTWVEISAPIL